MRFGRTGSLVDNASSGGFFIPVDMEEGCFKEYEFQFLELSNNYIYEHPDTNIKLNGYKIPCFQESKELVKKAAKDLGDKIVGWDIALSKEGPVLIEGNYNYHIGMSEKAYGGYKEHPIFKKIIAKYI